LELAFESLLIEGYQSFLLTITILTVAIFETNNGCFKGFDSHSWNARGMSDPFGTCSLLEVSSVAELVEYFRNLYFGREDAEYMYEVKGVKRLKDAETRNVASESVATIRNGVKETHECCVVCLYAICFSEIKGVLKWDKDTLESIIENAREVCEKMSHACKCSMLNFPNVLVIKGADVKFKFDKSYKELIQDDLSFFCCSNGINCYRKSGYQFRVLHFYRPKISLQANAINMPHTMYTVKCSSFSLP